MTADIRTLSEHKRRIAAMYNLAADGYDKPSMRCFRLIAERLVERTPINAGALVLDAATGTGTAAFAAVHQVGPQGRVLGVDIAADMLAHAKRKVAVHQLTNITMQYGDIEHLDFANYVFDNVLCASGIFFLPDMLAALKEWQRVTKPGGWLAFSSYGVHAFQPLSDLFEARIRRYGVPSRPFTWQRLSDREQCHDLMRASGFVKVEVCVEQLGYDLDAVDEWWDIVWNSGFRGPVSRLSSAQLRRFRQEHLVEIGALATAKGIWLDGPAIFVVGQNPGSA